MGHAMGVRLMACGHQVTVWNRTRAKAEPLVQAGALLAKTPSEAAAGASVVISSVKDDAALRAVALGPDGILAGLRADAVHAETSTVSPIIAAELADIYNREGRRFVHCPVLGNKRHIAEGKLLFFCSGDPSSIEMAKGALSALGDRFWTFDEPERAAAIKLACNMLIATMICGLSQSLVFGKKYGVPPELLLEIIQSSNLASPMYQNKTMQILARNWSANFFVDNLAKDVTIALDSGRQSGIAQPVLAVIQQLLIEASAKGYGLEDYSAVSKVFEDLAGVELA